MYVIGMYSIKIGLVMVLLAENLMLEELFKVFFTDKLGRMKVWFLSKVYEWRIRQ